MNKRKENDRIEDNENFSKKDLYASFSSCAHYHPSL